MRTGNKRRIEHHLTGPSALIKWPLPPGTLRAPGEHAAWKRLGPAVMAAGTLTAADLPLLVRLAQLSARVDVAIDNPLTKATALAALMRLEIDAMSRCGLSPQGRATVRQPSKAPPKSSELAEFNR